MNIRSKGSLLMKTEPIMIFKVYADNRDVSNLECPYGAVTMIPFRATVESALFTGETLPGAVDVQIENPGRSRNVICAQSICSGEKTGMEIPVSCS